MHMSPQLHEKCYLELSSLTSFRSFLTCTVTATLVILRHRKSSIITTHILSLHWHPVKVRSTCKIASLCYLRHSRSALSFVTDMSQKMPSHSHNYCSSSYINPPLNSPAHSMAAFGERSFSFASLSVRCAPSLSSTKSRLMSYLLC